MPGNADVHELACAADPDEFSRIEARIDISDQRFDRHVVGDDAEHSTVARGLVIEPICFREAARGRHVLHDDDGVAWDMPADIARDDAGIIVVSGAWFRPGIDFDGAAPVELRYVVGAGVRREYRQHCRRTRR